MSLATSSFLRVAVTGYLGWRFDLDQIRRIVVDTSDDVEKEIQALLGGAGGGRQYPMQGSGTYQASSPGDLPAKRTGKLAESVLARRSDNQLAAWIGPSTKKGLKSPFYPAFLVYGTATMAKRKNATTMAMRRYRARFNRQLSKAMATSLKGQK
jgi:hypothetical protein